MKTIDSIPTSKISRASKLVTTGAKVGVNYLKYYGDKLTKTEDEARLKLNESNAEDIYDNPKWPNQPLFYANFPSVTDQTMAPEGCENAFFLIPIAPGLEDTPEIRSQYFDIIISRFEALTNQSIKNNVIFKESFCVNDFIKDYNSFKGNAYGMANTLLQTAFLRPNLKSKKVNNLYFTGQLTVPGPGVPPALISGKLVAELILKNHQ